MKSPGAVTVVGRASRAARAVVDGWPYTLVRAVPMCAVCPRASASPPLTAHAVYSGVQAVAEGAGGARLLQQDGAAVLSACEGCGCRAARAVSAPPAEPASAPGFDPVENPLGHVSPGARWSCISREITQVERGTARVVAGRVAGFPPNPPRDPLEISRNTRKKGSRPPRMV